MNIEELTHTFEMIEDNDEKFSYVIELGKQIPSFPKDKKDDNHKIYGCSSNVWFSINNKNGKYYFDFESDALIVKGLLFIIKTIFDGKSVNEIKNIDAENFFDKIGLKSILSNQRQVGLLSIIKKIKEIGQD